MTNTSMKKWERLAAGGDSDYIREGKLNDATYQERAETHIDTL